MIKSTGTIVVGCAYASGVAAAPWGMDTHTDKSPPPHVLFICVDDLRPQLGCYGNPRMLTPNIDRLAARGTLFERAYCQFAVCGPSRASVLSGMYPEHNGVRDNTGSFRTGVPDLVSLPEHFRMHGYTTIGMGKVFHQMANTDPVSWSQWLDIEGRSYHRPENQAGQERRRQNLAAREAAGETFNAHQRYVLTVGPFSEAAEVEDHFYPDGELAQRAIRALREHRDAESPLFLAVGFLKPHLPFIVPQAYWDLYNPEDFTLPTNGRFPEGAPDWHTHDSFELRGYSDVPKEGPLDESLLRRAMHGYYAACSFIDAQIGIIIDELARQEIDRNTIVVIFGDNGFHLGENNIIGKDTNYEAAAHCPLILSAPFCDDLRAGGLTRATVELIDIYPTLCELAGLPLPAQCDGASLAPLMRDPDCAWPRPAFTMNERLWNSPHAGYAMRTDRYRYIRWLDAGHTLVSEELYDYTLDPHEQRNLVNDPTYGDVLAALRRKFDSESPALTSQSQTSEQKQNECYADTQRARNARVFL